MLLNRISSRYIGSTEILGRQHYNFGKKIFDQNLNIEILTSKSDYKEKSIENRLFNNKIDIIFGTIRYFNQNYLQ